MSFVFLPSCHFLIPFIEQKEKSLHFPLQSELLKIDLFACPKLALKAGLCYNRPGNLLGRVPMNLFLFLAQTFLVVGFALAAFRLGSGALTAWIAIQSILANLFVTKQVNLLGFDVTASDAFAIGGIFGLNLLQEHFSKEEAQKATWISFFCMLFFVVASQLHLLYLPSIHDTTQTAFSTILSPAPRLFLASISVFLIVQQSDIRFFVLLKRIFPNRSFAFRTAVSLVFSQLLDTVLFTFAGLYGSVASVTDVILLSFLVKLGVIFCFSPAVRVVKARGW